MQKVALKTVLPILAKCKKKEKKEKQHLRETNFVTNKIPIEKIWPPQTALNSPPPPPPPPPKKLNPLSPITFISTIVEGVGYFEKLIYSYLAANPPPPPHVGSTTTPPPPPSTSTRSDKPPPTWEKPSELPPHRVNAPQMVNFYEI